MPEAIIVDWYGPYQSNDELRLAAKDFEPKTLMLYMGVRSHNIVGYIGLTESPHSRFNNHEKLADYRHRKFYLGEIVSRGVSGRRRHRHRSDHATAEHALIAYLQPDLNDRLRAKDIPDCCVIYSRFFDVEDHQLPRNPLSKFPLVVAYNSWSDDWDM